MLKHRIKKITGGATGTPHEKPAPALTHSDLPAPIAIPAALHQLAGHFHRRGAAPDTTLVDHYGPSPARRALEELALNLNGDLRFTNKVNASAAKAHFPCIALTAQGGSYILWCYKGGQITLQGQGDKVSIPWDIAHPHFSGRLLEFKPHLAGAKSDESAPTNAKPTGDRNIVVWLIHLLWKEHRSTMLQLLAAAMLCNLFLIALPLFIMSVYDRVIPHAAFESLYTLTIGIFIVLSADIGLRYVKLKFADAAGLQISQRLQNSLYQRLLHLKLENRPKSASRLTAIQGEIETVCLMVPEFTVGLFADTTFALIVLSIIAYIGGWVVIGPIIGVITVVGVIFMSAWYTRQSTLDLSTMRSTSANQVSESFDALASIKATGAGPQLLQRYEGLNDQIAFGYHLIRQRMRFASQAAAIIVQMTVVITLFLGVLRIDAGLMSIGSMAAITILVGRAVMPVTQLTDGFCRLWTLKDVLNGAFALLVNEESQGSDATTANARPFSGQFAFHNVTYQHATSQIQALDQISLTINPGEKLGIIGPNGSGKSTFLHLLPQLYEQTGGNMLLDGHDIHQYAPDHLRQYIGFMPQETVLFNETLLTNICLGSFHHTQADFNRAVTLSGVHQFAHRHPKGYSMIVGPRGEFLSAGERQSVGLARVLLRQKPVLVLDEPTSLMDHSSEGRVIQSLAAYAEKKTLILTTHRMKLLTLVDRLIVLDGGRVAIDGPKEDVLRHLNQRPSAPLRTQKTS